jgi:uncharacterized phage-associated protein
MYSSTIQGRYRGPYHKFSSPESLMLSPKSIANFMIDLANNEGQSLDPMKLQKLVYYAHGWYAGYSGQPLIDEEIEAWPYGPVIPSLYDEFKRFGSGRITGKATVFSEGRLCEVPPPGDPNIRSFLQNVWRSYGRYTGMALSEMTHAQGSPWDVTRKETNGMRGADIPFERIRDHFIEAVQAANRHAVPA